MPRTPRVLPGKNGRRPEARRARRRTGGNLPPVALAYTEPQRSKSAALKREATIKRLRRAEKDRLVAKR